MKRKRSSRAEGAARPIKKLKATGQLKSTSHPVLSRYYTKVCTLREYLLSRIPPTSKRRRRLLEVVGKDVGKINKPGSVHVSQPLPSPSRYHDAIALLDSVLVGAYESQTTLNGVDEEEDSMDFEAFSQQLNASGGRSQLGSQKASLTELVDFSIWLLFNRKYPSTHKPPHILCHGTLRASSTWNNGGEHIECGIPGLVRVFPNEHVTSLKGLAWSSVFSLIGKDGDKIILDLLVSCGIFMPMNESSGTYYQISGEMLSELQPLKVNGKATVVAKPGQEMAEPDNCPRSHAEIRFVRSRMLYARAALNAKRDIAFGLRHIHVLNRYPDSANASHTAHIMKYIFPRQFGLHNVSTSKTDPKETSQPFQDYTLRETEIARADMTRKVKRLAQSTPETARNIPKRLRGEALRLIHRLQVRHARCSYTKLLAHYCPLSESVNLLPSPRGSGLTVGKESDQTDLLRLATLHAQVSAFCRAVVSRVFPYQLFGKNKANRKLLNKNVDLFIKARRFESLTLETVMSGMQVREMDWLRPPHIAKEQKMSLSDFNKRREIFSELIYYIFDSFLIPLIRTNFHVTESSMHRNRLFYFRHDVWRRLTEPALNNLKITMFDEIGGEKALKSLEKRELGFSQIRLLPKEQGMRPITNLRRRTQTLQNGRKVLGRSINSILGPAFSILNYEKLNQPARLGASLFSISGIYERLRNYRQTLIRQGQVGQKLYFVKVDVKGCFDSIPQKRMIQLVHRLLSACDYKISRHAEIKPAAFQDPEAAKPMRVFASDVQVGDKSKPFVGLIEEQNKSHRPNTVFVDSLVPQKMGKKRVLQLLNEHVENNIVKIGKKFYRQKRGIPQGSVVSSLLCNFFYGDLEFIHLGFITPEQSVLFRLIDDFLLVTSDKSQARQFLEIMHTGIPSYGVTIKPEKSLVNFDVEIEGKKAPRLAKGQKFPYCGILIDSRNLNISKDGTSFKSGNVSDSLTVEYSKRPGYTFRRKTLSSLKIQMHTMLLDTSHNAKATVLTNLHLSMVETAVKAFHYMRSLKNDQRPSLSTLTRTVQELASLAFAMLRSKRNKERCSQYQCSISKIATQWITIKSFSVVFFRKQAKYNEFLAWLNAELSLIQKRCKREARLLETITARMERQVLQA